MPGGNIYGGMPEDIPGRMPRRISEKCKLEYRKNRLIDCQVVRQKLYSEHMLEPVAGLMAEQTSEYMARHMSEHISEARAKRYGKTHVRLLGRRNVRTHAKKEVRKHLRTFLAFMQDVVSEHIRVPHLIPEQMSEVCAKSHVRPPCKSVKKCASFLAFYLAYLPELKTVS